MHSTVRCHTMPAGVPLVEFMHLVFTRIPGGTQGNTSATIQTRVAYSRPCSRPVTASDSGLYSCIALLISSADSLPCVLIRCHTVRCTLALRRCGAIGRGAEGGGAGGVGVEGVRFTLRASLSGTFLQTLPDFVMSLKGHALSPRSCLATRSAPSERFGF